MEFHETITGKRFFTVQLPSLILALESIGEALERKQAPIKLPITVEEDFLKEFYYGNIGIGAASMENYSDERLKEITALQDELKRQLTEEQWELFQQCSSKASCYAAEESCRIFQHGFGLAVKLVMAGLSAGK